MEVVSVGTGVVVSITPRDKRSSETPVTKMK